MTADRHHIATRSRTNLSAVTNGARLLDGIDGRSAAGRRYRDLVRHFTAEIGGPLNAMEAALVKQAAALMLRSEMLQADLVNGKPVNTDDLIRLSSEARRILDAIKAKAAKRTPANDQPDLDAYLKQAAAR